MEIACHFQYITAGRLLQSWCIQPISAAWADQCHFPIPECAVPLKFMAFYAFSIRYLELFMYFA